MIIKVPVSLQARCLSFLEKYACSAAGYQIISCSDIGYFYIHFLSDECYNNFVKEFGDDIEAAFRRSRRGDDLDYYAR